MDQIVKALGVINSFQLTGLSGTANPTSGARLNLDASLGALTLTAADGTDPGVLIHSEGFGVKNLSLPTRQDPSLSLDPYLEHLRVDLDDRFFARAAVFAKEPVIAGMHHLVNRVMMYGIHKKVRLTSQKILHADVDIDKVCLQHDEEELVRIRDVSLTVLDFNTKKPPAVALRECVVVIRKMRIEVEQRFFERLLAASKKKIPPVIEKLDIELPDTRMVVDGRARVKIPISFRVDLRLETENDMFGIYFDRFYVPGTNMRLPGFTRNLLLGLIKTLAEDKLKGLVEISNESLRINPFSKIPIDLRKHVSTFAVENRKVVIEFTEPRNQDAPGYAVDYALGADQTALVDVVPVLAPGPSLETAE